MQIRTGIWWFGGSRVPLRLIKSPICAQRPGPFLSPWAMFSEGGKRNSTKTLNLSRKHCYRPAFTPDTQHSTGILCFLASILAPTWPILALNTRASTQQKTSELQQALK